MTITQLLKVLENIPFKDDCSIDADTDHDETIIVCYGGSKLDKKDHEIMINEGFSLENNENIYFWYMKSLLDDLSFE